MMAINKAGKKTCVYTDYFAGEKIQSRLLIKDVSLLRPIPPNHQNILATHSQGFQFNCFSYARMP